LSPKGAVLERSSAEQALVCSEASFGMVEKIFLTSDERPFPEI
jgi:hypothetical protein